MRGSSVVVEEFVSKSKVAAGVAWVMTVLLLLAGWVMVLAVPEHWMVGGMFAATACATSAVAATLHIRCYAVRLACLVRLTSNLPIDGAFDGPRPVRQG